MKEKAVLTSWPRYCTKNKQPLKATTNFPILGQGQKLNPQPEHWQASVLPIIPLRTVSLDIEVGMHQICVSCFPCY